MVIKSGVPKQANIKDTFKLMEVPCEKVTDRQALQQQRLRLKNAKNTYHLKVITIFSQQYL